MLIGVAAFVKPYALVLFPWLAVVGGLESAAIAGGVVVAGLLAPAVTYGWKANLDELAAWYRTVTDTTAPNLLDAENVSFASMCAKWIGPGRARIEARAGDGVPRWACSRSSSRSDAARHGRSISSSAC